MNLRKVILTFLLVVFLTAQSGHSAKGRAQLAPPIIDSIPQETDNTDLSKSSVPINQGLTEIMLTAIPPRLGDDFKLTAKPGEKIQVVIRVRNNSDKPVTIESSAEDFVVDKDGKTPIPVSDEVSSRWSLASWMSLSPTKQTIEPGKSANINVVIDVPTTSVPGGHYAMVLHQPQLTSNTGQSQTSIGQRVGTLIYFVVDGPINREAFLRNFKMPRFTEFGPVPFSFTVENVSDIHIQPQIGVEIYNIFGQKVETVGVESHNVFPFVARDFEGEWSRIWGVGLYKAKAIMSYGPGGQIAIASTSFWLLPIKLVVAILCVILAIIGMIVAVRRHLIHRQQLNEQKIRLLEKKVAELEERRDE